MAAGQRPPLPPLAQACARPQLAQATGRWPALRAARPGAAAWARRRGGSATAAVSSELQDAGQGVQDAAAADGGGGAHACAWVAPPAGWPASRLHDTAAHAHQHPPPRRGRRRGGRGGSESLVSLEPSRSLPQPPPPPQEAGDTGCGGGARAAAPRWRAPSRAVPKERCMQAPAAQLSLLSDDVSRGGGVRPRAGMGKRSLHAPLEQLSLPSDDSSRGSGVRPRGGMEEPTRQAPLESDDRRALQARKHEAHTRNMRGSTGLRGPWVGAGAGGRGCARQCDTQELRNSLYRNCRVSQQPRTHACAVCADRRVHSTHLDAGVHAPIGPRLAHWRTLAMPGDGGRLAPARSAATPHLTLLAGPKAASRTDMAHSPRG